MFFILKLYFFVDYCKWGNCWILFLILIYREKWNYKKIFWVLSVETEHRAKIKFAAVANVCTTWSFTLSDNLFTEQYNLNRRSNASVRILCVVNIISHSVHARHLHKDHEGKFYYWSCTVYYLNYKLRALRCAQLNLMLQLVARLTK